MTIVPAGQDRAPHPMDLDGNLGGGNSFWATFGQFLGGQFLLGRLRGRRWADCPLIMGSIMGAIMGLVTGR